MGRYEARLKAIEKRIPGKRKHSEVWFKIGDTYLGPDEQEHTEEDFLKRAEELGEDVLTITVGKEDNGEV